MKYQHFVLTTLSFLLLYGCITVRPKPIKRHIDNPIFIKMYTSSGKYDAAYDFIKEAYIEPASRYEEIEKIEYGADKLYKVTKMTSDSILYSTCHYSVYDTSDHRNDIAYGEYKNYYEDGKLKSVQNYNKNGKLDGDFRTYYPNGRLRRHDIYNDSALASGKCFDSTGEEIEWFEYSKDPAVDLDLFEYYLKYPEKQLKAGLEARIVFRVFVDENGKPLILKFDKDCPEGFVNSVVYAMKQKDIFKPRYIDGEPVGAWITLPVTFEL